MLDRTNFGLIRIRLAKVRLRPDLIGSIDYVNYRYSKGFKWIHSKSWGIGNSSFAVLRMCITSCLFPRDVTTSKRKQVRTFQHRNDFLVRIRAQQPEEWPYQAFTRERLSGAEDSSCWLEILGDHWCPNGTAQARTEFRHPGTFPDAISETSWCQFRCYMESDHYRKLSHFKKAFRENIPRKCSEKAGRIWRWCYIDITTLERHGLSDYVIPSHAASLFSCGRVTVTGDATVTMRAIL